MNLIVVDSTTIGLLDQVELTPPPRPEWVAYVEDFLLGPAVGAHLSEPMSVTVAAVDAGTVVGAAVHYPRDADGRRAVRRCTD